MRILVTSDNHLGHSETDPVRGSDSFDTFDEILQIARAEAVDFIIQGGDLFDENRPSRNTYNRTISLLRTHCTASSARDASQALVCLNRVMNWNSDSLRVSLPVLSIHGNHDDPSGFGSLSPHDILSSAGLINYFGRVTLDSTNCVTLEPILLTERRERDEQHVIPKKVSGTEARPHTTDLSGGAVKVALYGLGYINNRRVYRLFSKNGIKFARPDSDGWFNILVVHQNRVPRPEEYLPENFIPSFFDLVIYGHEHDSVHFRHRNFEVIQSGSTVRTSLCDGERGDKYVYILDLAQNSDLGPVCTTRRIKLRSVRTFVMESMRLESTRAPQGSIVAKLGEMLERAKMNASEEYDAKYEDGRCPGHLLGQEVPGSQRSEGDLELAKDVKHHDTPHHYHSDRIISPESPECTMAWTKCTAYNTTQHLDNVCKAASGCFSGKDATIDHPTNTHYCAAGVSSLTGTGNSAEVELECAHGAGDGAEREGLPCLSSSEKLPLIRLRVNIPEGHDTASLRCAISEFLTGRVANPEDAVKLVRHSKGRSVSREMRRGASANPSTVLDIYGRFLKDLEPAVLQPPMVLNAMQDFLLREERGAFEAAISKSVASLVSYIDLEGVMIESIDETVRQAGRSLAAQNETNRAVGGAHNREVTLPEDGKVEDQYDGGSSSSHSNLVAGEECSIADERSAFGEDGEYAPEEFFERKKNVRRQLKPCSVITAEAENDEYTFIEQRQEAEERAAVMEKIKKRQEEDSCRKKIRSEESFTKSDESEDDEGLLSFSKYL